MTDTRRVPRPGPQAHDVRRGQPDPQLRRVEFDARFHERFADPAFDGQREAIAALCDIAWRNYEDGHKSPRTAKAGPGFADPDYALSDEWRATSDRLAVAERTQKDPATRTRILLICASPRSEHTCPGEMSKTWRLLQEARQVVTGAGIECEVLELDRLASEYGRHIHPCKACVSTAMPLCHWPCSCYPNHGMGQVQDWMADIYEMWVRAHGVLIVTPVHWNQAPSPLKLMMDRMVCADGGNPDPTTTQGKTPALAKQLELDGWDYPQHLAGRAFGLVVHGDSEGTQSVRHALHDWLLGIGLVDSGPLGAIDRYIGYYKPYATSHAELDADQALFEETRNVARALVEQARRVREGIAEAGEALEQPRQK